MGKKLPERVYLPIHPHPLSLIERSEDPWKCDLSPIADYCQQNFYHSHGSHYRCEQCDYDICMDCVRLTLDSFSKVLHDEEEGSQQLKRSTLHPHWLIISSNRSGWYCDHCKDQDAGMQRWRCSRGCEFDICGECVKETFFMHLGSELRLKWHPHPLYKTFKEIWNCDVGLVTGRCELSEEGTNMDSALVWECKKCNFNICENCIHDLYSQHILWEEKKPTKLLRISYEHSHPLIMTHVPSTTVCALKEPSTLVHSEEGYFQCFQQGCNFVLCQSCAQLTNVRKSLNLWDYAYYLAIFLFVLIILIYLFILLLIVIGTGNPFQILAFWR